MIDDHVLELGLVVGPLDVPLPAFAKPAVTVARMFTDTLAGIEPSDAPMCIVAQLGAEAAGIALIRFLPPDEQPVTASAPVQTGPRP